MRLEDEEYSVLGCCIVKQVFDLSGPREIFDSNSFRYQGGKQTDK